MLHVLGGHRKFCFAGEIVRLCSVYLLEERRALHHLARPDKLQGQTSSRHILTLIQRALDFSN